MENWHSLPVDEVLKELDSSPTGLSEDEAKKRLLKYGRNELETKKKTSAVIVFLSQFKSPLIYVLVIAAVVSFLVGHFTDGFVVSGYSYTQCRDRLFPGNPGRKVHAGLAGTGFA